MGPRLLGGEARRHPGFDEPGGDRVDGNAARGHLSRHRFGQSDEPRFRRHVVCLSRIADLGDDGRDVDDPASMLTDEFAQHGSCAEECAAEIRVQDRRPILVFHAQDERVADHASIVDQDVDFSERFQSGGDQLARPLRRGQIGLNAHSASAQLADGSDDCFCGVVVRGVVHHNRGAFRRQGGGNRAAQRPRASGDDRNLRVEFTHCPYPGRLAVEA